MREIKFRAWNGKYMLNSAYGDWVSFDGVPYTEADSSGSRNIEVKKAKDYILMQFTGLKDKNGKDIYEGDIVQRGVILFGNGKFQGYYYESNGGIAESWEDDLCQERNIEVLGNMYENPELMKSDF